jgi:hypothetical protein
MYFLVSFPNLWSAGSLSLPRSTLANLKRRLVREEPSEEERKRVEGPNLTPFRHSVAEPARLEAVAPWEN